MAPAGRERVRGFRRAAAWRLAAGVALLALWALPEAALPAGALALEERVTAWLAPLAYAAFAWGFARTLAPGQEPLIARYSRFDERRDAAECAGYARGLTLFWAAALALTALGSAAALLAGQDPGWVPDLILLALFLGEHAVRSLRFPAGGIAWPDQTLRAILRAERARHG